MLELIAATKKEICGLCLLNEEQMLAKFFANDSLLFLKTQPDNLKKALEVV